MSVKWSVESLKRKATLGSSSDVVTHISWLAELSEVNGVHTHTGHRSGIVPLTAHDDSNFKAYSSITKDDAISWVKAAIGSTEVTNIEESLQLQITGTKSSDVKEGLPWGPVSF